MHQNIYLKKLQSIDSKGYKLALGIPVHSSSKAAYRAAGVLPLEDLRKLAASKYMLRSAATGSFSEKEIELKSDVHFAKRARQILSNQTINTYTSTVLQEAGINRKDITQRPSFSPIPNWELKRPDIENNFSQLKKSEFPHVVRSDFLSYVEKHHSLDLKIYTDGSVLDNKSSGAAFVIPSLNVEKKYYLGKNYSIFTAELIAILMALQYIQNLNVTPYKILFCVDSQSVLQSLKSIKQKIRTEIIIEIKHLIHIFCIKGIQINFCWVPSHCNIFSNEKADLAANKAAQNDTNSISVGNFGQILLPV